MDFEELLKNVEDVLDLWEKLVAKDPDTEIIVDGGSKSVFTRKQVDELAGKVYAYLVSKGIGREDMVMICLPRGAYGIIAMLGVWKAGAAFTVAENTYPEERIDYIRKNAGCKTVIDIDTWMTITGLEPLWGHKKTDLHDAAFAVYTSGSTGNPKGVLHEYGTLKLNLISGIGGNKYVIDNHFRIAHIAPFGFVASIKIILTSVTTGLVMHILPYDTIKNPLKLRMYFLDNQINCAFITPSILRAMGTDFGPYLDVVITGSEPAGGIEAGNIVLINTYSMSEGAFTIAEFLIDKKYDVCPVGKPNFPELIIRLLDEEGNDVPKGEEGEICFTNPYFRGYIGLKKETEDAFRGGIFHTGDTGRFDENGNLILTGRINDMIKINGNRIEPGEIEAAAKKILPVRQCVVRGFEYPTRSFLCLYYVADEELDVSAARERLSSDLPYYMIPSYFIRLDDIPLLASGKIDKNALKAPKPGSAEAYVPPRNDIEEKLCRAIEKVLSIEKVGIYDDFYDLGGDSLSSMNVLAESGIDDLNAMDIFKGRNVETIARLYDEKLKNNPGTDPLEYEAEARKKALPLTVIQTNIFDRQLYNAKETMWNLPQMYVTHDLSMAEKLCEALNRVVKNHPVFSMVLEFGENDLPIQRYDESTCPVIEIEEMTEEEYAKIKPGLVRLHRLMGHPLFEVRLIRTEQKVYLFFNPHHIMIDGMGYQALYTNVARAVRGEELLPDTFCTFLAQDHALRTSKKYEEDKEFFDILYGSRNWCRQLIPDLNSHENLMNFLPLPIQVSIEDAVSFENASKLSRNGLFTIATMMAMAKCTGMDDIMIAWSFHNRTDASRMRAVGLVVRTLPLGLSFNNIETLQDLYAEIKQQSALGLEHESYEYTLAKDNLFESDTMAVVYETAAIADQGSLSEIGLYPGQGAEEAVNNNKVALQNICMLVYELPDMIQPTIIYSKSLYSDELMERFSDAVVNYIHKIIEASEPDKTLVADILNTEGKPETTGEIAPDTRVKTLAAQYPWMVEELAAAIPETSKYMNNPIARKVAMNMTLDAVAKQMGMSFNEIKNRLDKLIKDHNRV